MRNRAIRIISFLAAFASIMLVAACQQGGSEPEDTPHIELLAGQDPYPTFGVDGGSVQLSFSASSNWTAVLTSDRASGWLKLSPQSGGAGEGTVAIQAAPNKEFEERTAGIQIKCGSAILNASVAQKQKDAITLSRTKYELDASETTLHLEYGSNIEVSFSIADGWVKPINTKLFMPHSKDFLVEANGGSDGRSTTIELSGNGIHETVHIYQAGEKPAIVLSPKELAISADAQEFFVDVSSNISVQLAIPGECGWLREVKTKTMSTDRYFFEADMNDGGDRSAVLVFTNTESGLEETFTVIQHKQGSLYVRDKHFTLFEDETQITVYVASDIPYSVNTDSDWLHYADTASLQGYLRHYFDVKALPENQQERTARIVFDSPGYGLSDTVKVLQTRDRSPSIVFKDEKVKRICVEKWDHNGDGELSETEAAAVKSLGEAFSSNGSIVSFDELKFFTSLESIGGWAFANCSLLESVSFPPNLETIGHAAFNACALKGELMLPESVISLGDYAFANCKGLDGVLNLPDRITKIGSHAFESCVSITGLHLPEALESIGEYAFNNCTSMKGSLVIPDKVTEIPCGTFQHSAFDGMLTLSPRLRSIGLVAFTGAGFHGSIEFPATMEYLGPSSLHGTDFDKVTMKGSVPPVMDYSTFMDVDFMFYVPEGAVNAYRTAPGWHSYRKNITTEGHQPSDFPYYKSSDYSRDGEIVVLQQASKGRGVNLIFMGDGYTDLSMAPGGLYEQEMKLAVEALFAYEPYHSLRDRFNIYIVKVVSENDLFNDAEASRRLSDDNSIRPGDLIPHGETVDEYSSKVPNPYSQPVVVTIVSNVEHSAYRPFALVGETHSYGWIGFPLNESRNLWECELAVSAVAHETGGHAFARLADEYVEMDGTFSLDDKWSEEFKKGWRANIDTSSDPEKVKWADRKSVV